MARTFLDAPHSSGHVVTDTTIPPVLELLLVLLSAVYGSLNAKSSVLFTFLTARLTVASPTNNQVKQVDSPILGDSESDGTSMPANHSFKQGVSPRFGAKTSQ